MYIPSRRSKRGEGITGPACTIPIKLVNDQGTLYLETLRTMMMRKAVMYSWLLYSGKLSQIGKK